MITVIEILIKLFSAIFIMALSVVIGFGLWRLLEIPIRRSRASTFDYIYVDDDGTARELNAAEYEFVTTALFTDDDAGECIKPQYESLTCDGRLRGYLLRRQLPRQITVGPAPE